MANCALVHVHGTTVPNRIRQLLAKIAFKVHKEKEPSKQRQRILQSNVLPFSCTNLSLKSTKKRNHVSIERKLFYRTFAKRRDKSILFASCQI